MTELVGGGGTIPLPPREMRQFVGDPPPESWENPSGEGLQPKLPDAAYTSVLDFGCGCGRTARRALQMRTPPERYLGIDIHRGMVAWCSEHLAPLAPGRFTFEHHDVFNALLNPDPLAPAAAPIPAADDSVTFVEGCSIFTHLVEPQAEFYLDELARVLAPGGWMALTFLLFDRAAFPVLQPFQHALYVNEVDPTNAVYLDRAWLQEAFERRGLVIAHATPPPIRGFQWTLLVTTAGSGIDGVELPEDTAPIGSQPPPARASSPADRLAHYDGQRGPARELVEAKRYIADLEIHLARKDAELRAALGLPAADS